MAQGFDSKEEYTTLTRLQSPYRLLVQFIGNFFVSNNWNHTTFLFEDSSTPIRDCFFGAGAVFHYFNTIGFIPMAYSLTDSEYDVNAPGLSQEKTILLDIVKPVSRGKLPGDNK